MARRLRHSQPKGRATDWAEPTATASAVDSTPLWGGAAADRDGRALVVRGGGFRRDRVALQELARQRADEGPALGPLQDLGLGMPGQPDGTAEQRQNRQKESHGSTVTAHALILTFPDEP